MRDIGWDHSSQGWLSAMGETGDATRWAVLDAPMRAALPASGRALDIGCGEGRFCRMMQDQGLQTIGLDVTDSLLERAQELDPKGIYQKGSAETLPFDDTSFDVAVFYLSLIDIPDFRSAISEAARVLRPGGRILVGNLHAHVTARPRNWKGEGSHWVHDTDGSALYLAADDMMVERSYVAAWGDIRIENYHRPLSAYMGAFLEAGLILHRFEDPPCIAPDSELVARYQRMPWAFFMAWDKPETPR